MRLSKIVSKVLKTGSKALGNQILNVERTRNLTPAFSEGDIGSNIDFELAGDSVVPSMTS